MRRIICFILFVCAFSSLKASHISGGEIYYTYLGKSAADPTKLSYKITLLLYKDTTVTGATVANLSAAYNISIYKGSDNSLLFNTVVNMVNYEYMKLTTYNPCLSNKPRVEFSVATYETIVNLDPLPEGYYVSHSQCCRVATVLNMNSNLVGATYWVKIPGSIDNPFAPDNSSAFFNKKDTILVCKSTALNLDFSATDIDGDSLVYSFASGYFGAGAPPNQLPLQSDVPPYGTVTYFGGYTFSQPFGTNATIDSKTGLVTGLAPSTTGIYLVTVKVEEYRSGQKISEHRKEFQIKVEDCSISAAALKPSYITCNGFTMSFQNESSSSSIIGYLWDFGDIKNLTKDTSSQPTPTYTYVDTGTFVMKLKVTGVGGCQDSAKANVRVYPGFTPGFSVSGSCYLNPYQFLDTTHTKYGVVNSWHWDFGDLAATNDTANINNPTYTYPSPASRNVKFYVSNSKGCYDSVTTQIIITDKPLINLPFRDTLICSNDTLPLLSNTNGGNISWTPLTRIINAGNANPLVYPNDTTTYYITVNNNGCINTDSVKVNVLQFISVDAGLDTSI